MAEELDEEPFEELLEPVEAAPVPLEAVPLVTVLLDPLTVLLVVPLLAAWTAATVAKTATRDLNCIVELVVRKWVGDFFDRIAKVRTTIPSFI